MADWIVRKGFSLGITDSHFWKPTELNYCLGSRGETFRHKTAATLHNFMSLCNSPEHKSITPAVHSSRKTELLLEMVVNLQKDSEQEKSCSEVNKKKSLKLNYFLASWTATMKHHIQEDVQRYKNWCLSSYRDATVSSWQVSAVLPLGGLLPPTSHFFFLSFMCWVCDSIISTQFSLSLLAGAGGRVALCPSVLYLFSMFFLSCCICLYIFFFSVILSSVFVSLLLL